MPEGYKSFSFSKQNSNFDDRFSAYRQAGLPETDNGKRPGSYTIGDLHGNAFKLFWILLYAGYCIADIKVQNSISAAYQSLDHDNFKKMLDKLVFVSGACHYQKLILLGDTLCDRGNSDYMTLMLYEKMAQAGINFTIVLSNHGLSFINAWGNRYYRCGFTSMAQQSCSFNYPRLLPEQRQDFERIATEIYIPRIKAFEVERASGKYCVFSHAPFDETFLRKAYKKATGDERKRDILYMIRKINYNLSQKLRHNREDVYHWIQDTHLEDLCRNRRKVLSLPEGYYCIFGHILDDYYLGKNQTNIDGVFGRPNTPAGAFRIFKIHRDHDKLSFMKQPTKDKAEELHKGFIEKQTHDLHEIINNAVYNYLAWINSHSVKALFNGQRSDKKRYAEQLRSEVNTSDSPQFIIQYIRKFFTEGHAGKKQHSFTGFFLNQLKLYPDYFKQLDLDISSDTDFTEDERWTNSVRASAIMNIQRMRCLL
ncbi:MAG: hypothetical protein GY718_02270 [Lentisphaerae bacterium]|nr:hypothetical protein [Lentisphaerota bacterium]